MTTEKILNNPDSDAVDYRGREVCFYHPNAKGTGSALRIEPRINRHCGDRYNCFFMELAAQREVARRHGGERSFARFDWERKITVKLGFADVCELLTVLEGRLPHVGGDRKGLYHQTASGNTLISFSLDTARGTFFLSVSRKSADGQEVQRIGIGLTEVEATGLRCLFQTGLFFITFPAALKHSRRISEPRAGVERRMP